MSAQLSYDIEQGKAYAGGLYAIGPHDVVSRAVETVAGIGFGLAVSRGTDKENQAVIGGTSFLGISVRSLALEGAANTGAIEWSETESMSVLRSGDIWATCPDGCNAGDAVNYVNATGVLGAGAAGVGETALDGATWESTAAAGELAILHIETTATTAGA